MSELLRLGHSPDPDDAFMWWPLIERDGRPPAVDTGRFRFETVAEDIETLNRRAEDAELEITAVSCAQYARVAGRYALTACGASLGAGYGPKLVSRTPMSLDGLRADDVVIAIPGTRTSAFAAASLLLGPGTFRYEVVPFEAIIDHVADGSFAAGLVIHEGQLTFEASGLHLVEDLGRWWTADTGLPLPLGANVIRRDLETRLGAGTLAEVTAILRSSLDHALAHREEAVEYALGFARGMTARLADEFIDLYVNRWTLDFGDSGRAAVRTFLARAHAAGILPAPDEITFVG